jgi:alpha-beta hydrolase superfamily lysophospholipase
VIQTARAPRDVRREILTVPAGDVDLALHVWRPQGETKGAVFYFHGLQSHAGWLWEVGPRFAGNDVALFVLDRRGSGVSGGERGDLPDAGTVIADYVAAVAHTRRIIGDDVPLTLFGHCLGGSFLAALLHHPDFTVRHEATVFCSTWLGRLHALLPAEERAALAAERSTEPWDAGLRSEDFTPDPHYQDFVDHDELAVRALTRRSRAVLLALENLYMTPDRPRPPAAPAAFVSGLTDPIVDLDTTHAVFQDLFGGRGTIVKFPTHHHYLFYTDVAGDLVDWTSAHTLLRRRDREV